MKSYSNDLAILTVLITHLGACKLKSKSASKLAEDLSLSKITISNVFDQYPELFVEAGNSKKYKDEKTYTLHLRYALRWTDKNSDGDDVRKPIEAEHLSTLLRFIDNQASQENAAKRQKIANYISVGAAVFAALAAIVTAVISSSNGTNT